jgi:hypothetical protein
LGTGALAASTAAYAGVPYDGGDYIPAPEGTKVALVYGQFSHADGVYADGKNVDPDAKLDVDVSILRLVGYGKVAGMPMNYQVLIPYGRAAAGGSARSFGKSSGVGDLIFASVFWPVANADTGTYVGITPYVYVPSGVYDRDRAVNLGENRFKGVLQMGASQRLTKHVVAEVGGDVTIYGDNDKYLGASRLEQKASYNLYGHLRYLFNDKHEVNVRFTHMSGGRTKVDGVLQNNALNTWSALATYKAQITPRFQVMLQGGRDLSIESGFRETSRVQVRLLRAF